jgi:hypothetical protein
MCLKIGKAKVKIAKQDITCYKTLRVDGVGNKIKFTSPYMDFPYDLGKIYTVEMRVRNGEVADGFHSYVESELLEGEDVFECTIPKGARYYVGTYASEKAYASNKIRIDKWRRDKSFNERDKDKIKAVMYLGDYIDDLKRAMRTKSEAQFKKNLVYYQGRDFVSELAYVKFALRENQELKSTTTFIEWCIENGKAILDNI